MNIFGLIGVEMDVFIKRYCLEKANSQEAKANADSILLATLSGGAIPTSSAAWGRTEKCKFQKEKR